MSGSQRQNTDPDHDATLPKWRKLIREELGGIHWRLILAQLVLKCIPKHSGSRIRPWILRQVGFEIGAGTLMWALPEFTGRDDMIQMLSIGKHCWFNAGIYLDLGARIEIGDYVAMGHDVLFMTSSHQINTMDNLRRAGASYAEPIRVGNRVWLGARCTILPGVTIADGAIVAAGATVTQDVPENALVAGVPARVIRYIGSDEDDPIHASN